MNITEFFEKFELFADAPNAVAKMRELVLELACHGKLVEQSSDDESASKLLARIESYLELLRSRRELRGSPVEPLDRNELPPIPSSWEWVPLGNVVDYGSSDKSESADISDGAWLLDLEDIEKDTSRLLQRKTFGESPSKSTKTAFRAGDVLYGKLRPYLNKVLVADAPGYCTTEIIPICTFGFIEPAYLCYALKRPEFLAYSNSKSYGMNLPRLGTDDARRAAFPLPPLSEQKRIVAKVDELIALCDRLEAQQQERDTRHAALARASLARFAEAPTPANLDFLFHQSYAITPADLRKSILTLAVQGKLVPQDPNDEPAEELAAPCAKKSVPPKGGRDAPFELPSTWRWMLLGQVSELINGDRSKNYPNKAEYVREGVAWINTGHIEPDGTLSTDSMHYLTRKKFDSLRSGKVRTGDLVYCLRGATLGKTAIITQFDEGAVASSLVIVRLSPAVDPRFAYRVLTSPLGREQIFQFDNGSAQPNLSANNVKKYWIPIPPLAEQRRIVAKVDQLMALVDQLESQLAEAKSRSAALLEAVVHELLNPSAEVIDLASYRAAIGC